MRTAKPMFGRQ